MTDYPCLYDAIYFSLGSFRFPRGSLLFLLVFHRFFPFSPDDELVANGHYHVDIMQAHTPESFARSWTMRSLLLPGGLERSPKGWSLMLGQLASSRRCWRPLRSPPTKHGKKQDKFALYRSWEESRLALLSPLHSLAVWNPDPSHIARGGSTAAMRVKIQANQKRAQETKG